MRRFCFCSLSLLPQGRQNRVECLLGQGSAWALGHLQWGCVCVCGLLHVRCYPRTQLQRTDVCPLSLWARRAHLRTSWKALAE